jgi:hypothetical protein
MSNCLIIGRIIVYSRGVDTITMALLVSSATIFTSPTLATRALPDEPDERLPPELFFDTEVVPPNDDPPEEPPDDPPNEAPPEEPPDDEESPKPDEDPPDDEESPKPDEAPPDEPLEPPN